jgi:hypothetical protein
MPYTYINYINYKWPFLLVKPTFVSHCHNHPVKARPVNRYPPRPFAPEGEDGRHQAGDGTEGATRQGTWRD